MLQVEIEIEIEIEIETGTPRHGKLLAIARFLLPG